MDRADHIKAGGVAGRLRQRLAQMLLHSSCATTSATAFVGLAKANNNGVASTVTDAAAPRQVAPPAPAERSRLSGSSGQRRRGRRSSRALVRISIDCSARSVGAAVLPALMPANGADGVDSRAAARHCTSNKNKLRPSPPPSSGLSSSTGTDGELAEFRFSSDGETCEEADDTARSSTLLSSTVSFSSDSTSDVYSSTAAAVAARPSMRRRKNPPRRAPRQAGNNEAEKGRSKKAIEGGGAVAAAAGSRAVVKRSHDPYGDFRSSMVEMVAGRRIYGADALGELLVWYLSLNSRRHHPAILAAFEDVWEAVLGNDDDDHHP